MKRFAAPHPRVKQTLLTTKTRHLFVSVGCSDPRGGESVEAGLVYIASDYVLGLGDLQRHTRPGTVGPTE